MTYRFISFILLAGSCFGADSFDVLIRNCRVVDGTGSPWFRASIGIRAERIAAIGPLTGATGTKTIDAKDQICSPGFIDIHSHARRGVIDVPTADSSVFQGVTTLIEGPDGSSPLPLKPYFDQLEAQKIAVNFGAFVGQGTVRTQVIGLANRKATADEIEKMREIVKQAMLDGALGMSTGLFYVPGNFSSTEEVIELAKVAGAYGGMHISHMRDEAEHVLDSVKETIRIGEEGHLPTQITHHKISAISTWGASKETLRLVDEARARGVDVSIDAYPYTASSTGLSALLPQWSLEGGQADTVKRLKDPVQRAKIKETIIYNLLHTRGAGHPKNVVVSSCAWDPELNGKSLAQITDTRGKAPTAENAAETTMDMLARGNCSMIYHAISEEDVVRIMRYPFTMIASDGEVAVMGRGVIHPRSYGTFARVLGVYVREKKVLTLEDAVRKMSGLPATRLNLSDRGLLRIGMKADVAIFDPNTIVDKATFENPHQYAVGVDWVLVNGTPILAEGKITGARPGRILRR